jgi:hypothetical protein
MSGGQFPETQLSDGGSSLIGTEESTLRQMGSSRTEVRLQALWIVAYYWPPREAFAHRCLYLAFNDHDAAVRGAALFSLRVKLRGYIQDATGTFEKLLLFLERLDWSVSSALASGVLMRADQAVARAGKTIVTRYRRQAGKFLAEMLVSVDAAKAYLEHQDPMVRTAALSVLYNHWKTGIDFRDFCLNRIATETDSSVRIDVLDTLAALCFKTHDKEVARLCAELARDASEPMNLRRTAYLALLGVVSMPIESILYASTGKFPEDADWPWVDSFLH